VMETVVIKLDPAEPDLAQIKKAAAILDAGSLVAFPTETVYGIACKVRTDSLAKLNEIKGRTAGKHYTLHIAQKTDVQKYVPKIGLKARKLIKTGWPGPLTIIFELDEPVVENLEQSLSKEVVRCLYKDNTIGIRCPENPIASLLLEQCGFAVVAPSANISDQPPATDAEQVLGRLSGQIEMILDGGVCKYKKSSTVAKLSKGRLEILREGAYSKKELLELSEVNFLFVCTGNTCRSPMAAGLFEKYLAKKLDCSVDNLSQMGYKISSAGTMGLNGVLASAEAVSACAVRGIDISGHKSRALTEQLIKQADYIYVMSRAHREFVVQLSAKAGDKCVLLSEGRDIPDPIGQSQQVYDDCAQMIEEAVKKTVSELWI